MKHTIIGVAVMLITAVMLSACGGGGDSPTGELDVQADKNLEIEPEENSENEMIEMEDEE
ncbi:hypothetical protein D7Z54_30625 [Salibacterium salarium]|uniref:Uncharacterized protein n=1 Tax=Salibacterium salarium TaxID=284579 RepID=A0A428MU04_9BACI|nr:hypothetical protein [Salibacterium salarium]RSL29556.1 hypothetical protein D7Z54_30625 [Salibacterium salarium]